MSYPGRFYPWDFKQVPNGYWRGEKGKEWAIQAVRFFIEEKCQIPLHEIPFKVNYRFFKEHGLRGISALFGDSPYQVIDAVYPGLFQPWELSNVPINYWKESQHIKQMMDCFLFKQMVSLPIKKRWFDYDRDILFNIS